jgi:urease accessory protein
MTPTDPSGPALLQLVQWLSPAFPTGAYAYSHGLEWMMASGDVRDGAAVQTWIADVLRHGSGRSDAILLARGLDPDADLDALDDLARAMAPSGERLREMLEQGAAFAATTSAVLGRTLPARALPLAVAQAAQGLDLPAEAVMALYLHAFAANLISAAVRFIPLGQSEGQKILAALHPLIFELAKDVAGTTLDTISTSVFRADMASMLHETQAVRIFRT